MSINFHKKIDFEFKSQIYKLNFGFFRLVLKCETDGILYIFTENDNGDEQLYDMYMILKNESFKHDFELNNVKIKIHFKHKEIEKQLLTFNIIESPMPIITKEMTIKNSFVKQISFDQEKTITIKKCPGKLIKLIISRNPMNNEIYIKTGKENLIVFKDNFIDVELNLFIFPNIIIESKKKCNCLVTVIYS